MTAGLQIQPVPSGSGVDQAEGNLAPVLRPDIRRGLELTRSWEALVDSGEVVLEPVGDEDGLSVGGLNDVFEGVEFRPMHLDRLAVLVIYRPGGQL